MPTGRNESLADACPNCGEASYQGGFCFKCGIYRPAGRRASDAREERDSAEFIATSTATKLGRVDPTDDDIDAMVREVRMRRMYSAPKEFKSRSRISISEHSSEAVLVLASIVSVYGSSSDGDLIHAASVPWEHVLRRLSANWAEAFSIDPRTWEELIAAAFDKAGYDEVTLTPRSKDAGRDVIAVRRGICSVRIIDSVKAYKPGRLVRHDDVRALMGVVAADPGASKGILTTTSDFAPGIVKDRFIKPWLPHRIELMNGDRLQEWFNQLQKK